MARFKKKIVGPGVYKSGGQLHAVSAERIQNAANTATKMLAAGMRIPAPWAHKDENGVVPSPLVMDAKDSARHLDAKTKGKVNWDSSINAGFWDKFEVDSKDGSLVGYVDVPGDASDPSTPAGKVGKTVKETSVFLVPEYEDGEGRIWEDALWHVALVNHPVESNQSNFESIKNPAHEKELAIAMSFSMADEVNSATLSKSPTKDDQQESQNSPTNQAGEGDNGPDGEGEEEDPIVETDGSSNTEIPMIVQLLSDRLGIVLPSDTDDSNFMDRIMTVLTNLDSDKEEEGLTTQPQGSQVASSPVAMSQESNKDDPNLVIMSKKAGALLEQQLVTLKKTFKDRIEALIRKGQIGRKYADDTLLPQVDAVVMSMEDLIIDDKGAVQFPNIPLAMALDTLESNVALTDDTSTSQLPDGAQVPADTVDMQGEENAPTDEQIQELMDEASI